MLHITSERYADWKAPRTDGAVLVWPDASDLIRRTHENKERLSSAGHSRIQGVPLAELRRQMRRFVGHDDALPLVATGHQTELYHPGVWAKNVLINCIAEAVGGQAYLFDVDTDAPKHLNLRWPPATSLPITDDQRITSASWSGQLAPPTPSHIASLESELHAAERSWDFRSPTGEFLRSVRRLSLEAESLSPMLVNALHEIDWSLGLRHHAMLVSPMFLAEPYLLFVHHFMSRADSVASDYNASLADYRVEQSIKTPGRPMPDLRVSGEQIESPFWVDNLTTGDRVRATLQKTAGGFSLIFADDAFPFAPAATPDEAAGGLQRWLRRHNLRIAPRALTLTTFLRLLLADQFVHGIGGGRYDQVADRFIHRQFGIEPPYFSVTTGTLYFPSALGRQRACVSCLVREGHHLRHAALGQEKKSLVRKIDSLPRYSLERRAAYYEMHRRLKDVGAPVTARWEDRLRDARRQAAEEDILFDRELFYGLQSRDRLESLISRYAELLPAAS
jgi:hypothetical protein